MSHSFQNILSPKIKINKNTITSPFKTFFQIDLIFKFKHNAQTASYKAKIQIKEWQWQEKKNQNLEKNNFLNLHYIWCVVYLDQHLGAAHSKRWSQ